MKIRCLFISCMFLVSTKGLAQSVKPQGFLTPKNSILLEARHLIDHSQWGLAQKKLSTFNPDNGLERAWTNLLNGLVLQGLNEMDESLVPLSQVVSDLRRSTSASPDQFRISGYALKKIGFYYRQKGDFEKAFGEHSIELEYFKTHGSADEIHDALISLDNDAFSLKDYSLDAMIISESIKVAGSIVDEHARLKALGMSWNNYAQTLPLLKKYPEAVDGAQKSIEYYSEYESLVGPSENYLVWAYTGKGSVLQLWMNDLFLKDVYAAEEKHQQLRKCFRHALELAAKRKITGDDLKQLSEKIQCLEGSLEDAVKCSTS